MATTTKSKNGMDEGIDNECIVYKSAVSDEGVLGFPYSVKKFRKKYCLPFLNMKACDMIKLVRLD